MQQRNAHHVRAPVPRTSHIMETCLLCVTPAWHHHALAGTAGQLLIWQLANLQRDHALDHANPASGSGPQRPAAWYRMPVGVRRRACMCCTATCHDA